MIRYLNWGNPRPSYSATVLLSLRHEIFGVCLIVKTRCGDGLDVQTRCGDGLDVQTRCGDGLGVYGADLDGFLCVKLEEVSSSHHDHFSWIWDVVIMGHWLKIEDEVVKSYMIRQIKRH